MAIPDFQSIMMPLLRFTADGHDHSNQDSLDALAAEFGLTDNDRKQLLPSGQQRVFDNRVAWARAHMKMALLLENPRRGIFRITERGKSVLEQAPPSIDLKFLRQFPEYIDARDKPKAEVSSEPEQETQTPEEQIGHAYEALQASLASELLSQLKAASPSFFEKVVVDVLVRMGYGGSLKDAGQAIGRSGDEGIDGVINEDRLGLDSIYIQAKKWEGSVSRPEIQKFAGALQGKRATKGVFITTSTFTDGAKDFTSNISSKIILLDGAQLARLMIEYGVGVSTEATYELKKIDSDFFNEG
ncbi:restriction endonuclease [Chlorobium phaeovibrioides]|uniref:Restriction endonuclease n=1 Tax=Chlorobium phaeovibrioides TaxID=1094 RepID=A0A5M8I8G4_CHLPH|nr:restriction endonuclease [Chlorobium phaeovibrioides]KAA6231733.1 restriction endonuclease [Chlorobium phaeovibrioides]MWV55290.1 restriction endonuclease [Chlorobium phaeovibrioides]